MSKTNIFIVEDDPVVVKILQASIEEMGYRVSGIADSGEAAIEMVRTIETDLVLMDIYLKGKMNGIEAAAQIRSMLHLPVVYLTAYPDQELFGKAQSIEVYGYVIKPFKYRELNIVIEIALQRSREEKRLKESESKYRTLFDEGIDGIAVAEASTGIIVDCNKAFCRLLGRNKLDLIGKHQKNIHPVSNKNKDVTFNFNQHRSGHEGKILTDLVVTKNGEIREVEVKASTIEIADSRYLLGVFRDVTKQNKIEAQLRQAQKMESIGTLAGGIAHDFNNILFRIYGYLEMAQEEVDDNPLLADYLKEVLEEAVRARDLVKQILTFSRQTEQEFAPLDISLITKEAIKLLKSSIPSTIEIRHYIKKDISHVLADPAQIHQVIMNLVTNAYQVMEETGGELIIALNETTLTADLIHVKGVSPGRYACLKIKDTGSGILPHHLSRIFDPYFTTKDKDKGTGLGLAIVNGIVKNHRGYITVDSKPETGTEFNVYLPVIENLNEPEFPADDRTPLFQKGRNEHILLVDDEEGVVQMAGKMLKRMGYRLTSTRSSKEAVEIFQAYPDQFDLVITDLTMPHLTGDKMAAEILKVRPDIPIIMFTGFSEKITSEKASEIGIRRLLIKPIRKIDLSNEIRKILDEK